jgi:hypothetical protein
MEVVLDKRALKQLRMSVADAIQEGDDDALKEELLEVFPDEQIEEMEQRLGSGDFSDLLGDILDEWSGDDVDELLELLETQLGEHGIHLKYEAREDDEEEETEEEESEFEEYDELDEGDAEEGER